MNVGDVGAAVRGHAHGDRYRDGHVVAEQERGHGRALAESVAADGPAGGVRGVAEVTQAGDVLTQRLAYLGRTPRVCRTQRPDLG
ncbi:hypothetical protein [Nocardia niigatensis]